MFILGITFKEFITKGNVIAGLISSIVGVAIWLLAVNVTKSVRKSDMIKQDDTVLIACKVAGLVMLLIGMVLIAIPF